MILTLLQELLPKFNLNLFKDSEISLFNAKDNTIIISLEYNDDNKLTNSSIALPKQGFETQEAINEQPPPKEDADTPMASSKPPDTWPIETEPHFLIKDNSIWKNTGIITLNSNLYVFLISFGENHIIDRSGRFIKLLFEDNLLNLKLPSQTEYKQATENWNVTLGGSHWNLCTIPLDQATSHSHQQGSVVTISSKVASQAWILSCCRNSYLNYSYILIAK